MKNKIKKICDSLWNQDIIPNEGKNLILLTVYKEIEKKLPREVKLPKAGVYKEEELDDFIKFVVAYNNAIVDCKSVIKQIMEVEG